MKPYGIWSNERCCFVTLGDLTGSDIGVSLGCAVLSWGEPEPAVSAIPRLAELTGLADLEAMALRESDRPEIWHYVPLRTHEDLELFLSRRRPLVPHP